MGLGPSFPIVIQSGLAPGAPATVGQIPQFAGSSPPDLLIDSIAREVAGPPQAIIIGTTDPAPTATETLRTVGGFVSEGASNHSLVLGEAASVASASQGAIAIGFQASAGVGAENVEATVVIGYGNTVVSVGAYTGGAAESSVVIGAANQFSATSGQENGYTVIVGSGNTVNSSIGSTAQNNLVVGHLNNLGNAAGSCIVLGSLFDTQGQTQIQTVIAIGIGVVHAGGSVHNILIGSGAFCAANAGGNSVAIGRSASLSAGGGSNVVIGAFASIGSDFAIAIGAGAGAAGTGCIAIGRQAQANQADCMALGTGAVPIRSHQVVFGSGNTGGDFQEFVFGNRGALIANGVSDVFWHMSDIDGTAPTDTVAGNLRISAGIGLGAAATGGEIQFETGAPGASSQTAQVRTKQFSILKSAGGANEPNTAWDNVSNGAGAGAGTLLNAPSAGNPSMWLPVRINGAVRYIPCWT